MYKYQGNCLELAIYSRGSHCFQLQKLRCELVSHKAARIRIQLLLLWLWIRFFRICESQTKCTYSLSLTQLYCIILY